MLLMSKGMEYFKQTRYHEKHTIRELRLLRNTEPASFRFFPFSSLPPPLFRVRDTRRNDIDGKETHPRLSKSSCVRVKGEAAGTEEVRGDSSWHREAVASGVSHERERTAGILNSHSEHS